MNRYILLGVSLGLLVLVACNEEVISPQSGSATCPGSGPANLASSSPTVSTQEPLDYQVGRNDYVVTVDGDPRQFIVYVPTSYDPAKATPLLFAFHGFGGSGNDFYESSDWKGKAEQASFIAVFPTALCYTVALGGQTDAGTGWSTQVLHHYVQPAGRVVKDDTIFIRTVFDVASNTWNLDPTRLYAVGFSNGAGFVDSELMPKMSDIFAAFATAEGGVPGSQGLEGLPVPPRDPIEELPSRIAIFGTADQSIVAGGYRGATLPFEAEDVMADELLRPGIDVLLARLQLSPTYDAVYERPDVSKLIFNDSLIAGKNELVILMVKDMGHVYPEKESGFSATDRFWAFFVAHPKS